MRSRCLDFATEGSEYSAIRPARGHDRKNIFQVVSYRDGREFFPQVIREVRLRLLASDVLESVCEVPFHLRASVRRVEALDVLVNQGNQTGDVTPGDLIERRHDAAQQ